jgi:hypothetical protein
VHDGPVLVANMSVNLGPVGGLNGTAPGPDGGLGYNPRGLKRDVGPAVNMRYANYSTVLSESNLNLCGLSASSILIGVLSQTFCRSLTSQSTVHSPKVPPTPLRSALMAADTT